MTFWRKRQSKKDKENKVYKELSQKLNQLEKAIHELKDQGVNYEITIEELNVHDPVLDQLTFRLDKLDVKELSGALNLGNNFGVKVEPKKQQKKKKQSGGSSSEQSGSSGSGQEEQKQRIVMSQDDTDIRESFMENGTYKRHKKGMTFSYNPSSGVEK